MITVPLAIALTRLTLRLIRALQARSVARAHTGAGGGLAPLCGCGGFGCHACGWAPGVLR